MTKYTEEEKYELILKCRASGLSERAWCGQNDIKVGTFRGWYSSFKKKGVNIPPAAHKKSENVDTCTIKVEVMNRTIQNHQANDTASALEIDFGIAVVKVSNTVRQDILEKVIQLLDGKISNRKK